MPAWLLIVIVVGIVAVLVSTWIRGGAVRPALDDHEVHEVLAQRGLEPLDLCVSDDGLTALFLADTLGIVARSGQHLLVRAAVASVREDGDGLEVVLGEWGSPGFRVALRDPDARAVWMARA